MEVIVAKIFVRKVFIKIGMCRQKEYRNRTYICGGWIVYKDAGATVGKERA